MNDAVRQAALEKKIHPFCLVESRQTTFYTHVFECTYYLSTPEKKKNFQKITKLTGTIPLNIPILLHK